MSLAEVKEQITRLTPAEREELALYLRAKRLIDSPDHRQRIAPAHREIDAGQFVTLQQLKELLAKNQASPRGS